MKSVTLFHNPKAGDGEHSKKQLISIIEQQGFHCRYFSTKKKEYKNFEKDTDLLVAAGGDGTVEKVLKLLVTRKLTENFKVAIFPLGTANNIVNSIAASKRDGRQAGELVDTKPVKFDMLTTAGDVEGVCFESVGFGAFTNLIEKMKSNSVDLAPDDKLKFTLEQLRNIVSSYQAREARVVIDETVYSGKFLWVEILNISSIGPNIIFSDEVNPSDGKLNVVLIEERHRDQLLAAIDDKMNGLDSHLGFEAIPAEKVEVHFKDTALHIDDQLLDLGKPVDLKVRINPRVFTLHI